MPSPRVAVIGVTGFAGALGAALLQRHPHFELGPISSRSHVGERLRDVYPRHRVDSVIEETDTAIEVDAALVANPHGTSAPVVAAFRERGVPVVDLSADFRLESSETYEAWYGEHGAPHLAGEGVYGLPELGRETIAGAGLVANPGCYPTAALLALAPLARAGLLADVVIDAKSGVSGAGRTPTDVTHFSAAAENITPYAVGSHRHTPEIEQELRRLGADLRITFTTHLVPLDQGELISAYVIPTSRLNAAELAELFAEAYAGEPFVELSSEPPGVREVRETNLCRISTHVDEPTDRLIVFAAIDNLWKGAASQAIQNLNLMLGRPEVEGLL